MLIDFGRAKLRFAQIKVFGGEIRWVGDLIFGRRGNNALPGVIGGAVLPHSPNQSRIQARLGNPSTTEATKNAAISKRLFHFESSLCSLRSLRLKPVVGEATRVDLLVTDLEWGVAATTPYHG
jgi:hypothetical protein